MEYAQFQFLQNAISSNSASDYETWAIDLTQSWSTTSVSATVFNKSDEILPMRRPDLFYNPVSQNVYTLGGEPYTINGSSFNGSVKPQFWSFSTENQPTVKWENAYPTLPEDSYQIAADPAMALTATSESEHFSLGGYTYYNESDGSQAKFVQDGLLSFDFANKTFRNDTSVYSQLKSLNPMSGDGQYVPYWGESGLILFFGGQWPNDIEDVDPQAIGLDQVYVYDIYSDTFTIQAATLTSNSGPTARLSFCSVGAGMNTANPSYEMWVDFIPCEWSLLLTFIDLCLGEHSRTIVQSQIILRPRISQQYLSLRFLHFSG